VALKCKTPADFERVTPQRWLELAQENDTPEPMDFPKLHQYDTDRGGGGDREGARQAVVNSNQRCLGCLKRLKDKLGDRQAVPANLGH